jgi:hypothetical protein
LIQINLQNLKFTKVGNRVFSQCLNLEEVLIDDQFFLIGGTHLFFKCKKLNKIEIKQIIKENRISIKSYVFAYCNNLKKIIFSKSFNHLCSFVFIKVKI